MGIHKFCHAACYAPKRGLIETVRRFALKKVQEEELSSTPPAKVAEDTPLPATLAFVLIMGACFLIGWFVLFLLLKERW